ncbi:MAG: hypothetical protein KC493_12215 [Bacteriovoracaceae bacterium]|nr:hypothetical protein [Bacteriovoracaceae bacterium]
MAHKLNVSGGYYSYSAKTSSGSSSISGPSSWSFRYSHNVIPKFELSVGYTLNTESISGGDISYGADVGALYYPLSEAQTQEFKGARVFAQSLSQWRPKVGMFFHQRQFQSVKTNYAGFGFIGGTEWHWRDNFFLEGNVRMISLSGPNKSEADVTEILLGLSIDL